MQGGLLLAQQTRARCSFPNDCTIYKPLRGRERMLGKTWNSTVQKRLNLKKNPPIFPWNRKIWFLLLPSPDWRLHSTTIQRPGAGVCACISLALWCPSFCAPYLEPLSALRYVYTCPSPPLDCNLYDQTDHISFFLCILSCWHGVWRVVISQEISVD